MAICLISDIELCRFKFWAGVGMTSFHLYPNYFRYNISLKTDETHNNTLQLSLLSDRRRVIFSLSVLDSLLQDICNRNWLYNTSFMLFYKDLSILSRKLLFRCHA